MGGPHYYAHGRENRRPVVPGPLVRHRNRRQDDRLLRLISRAGGAEIRPLNACRPYISEGLKSSREEERMRLVHLIFSFCGWLQRTPIASYMRASFWAFPLVESLHILCGNVPLLVSTT